MTEYIVHVRNDGYEVWRNKESKLHRENGPAITWHDGDGMYYINGKFLAKAEFEARINPKPKHEGQVVVVDGIEYELKAKGE